MNPFEKHGITHLSASSLNLYINQPALWAGKYLYGWRDDVGAKAWVGRAVEAGLTAAMHGEINGFQVAAEAFEAEAQGVVDDETDKARAEVKPMLDQALLAMKEYLGCRPLCQIKIEYWFDGIDIPVIGYLDYDFEPLGIVDLKTTRAMPSAPRAEHAAQVALYCLARKERGHLLYVTPKRNAVYPVENPEEAIKPLKRAAYSLRNMLRLAMTKNDALSMFAPDFESFYWSDKTRAAYREAINV